LVSDKRSEAELGGGQSVALKSKKKYQTLYALVLGSIISSYTLLDKMCVSFVHPISFLFMVFCISAPIMTTYVLMTDSPKLADALKHYKKYAVFIAVFRPGGYLLVLFAFQIGNVSYVAPLRECSVVVGAILGFVFLKEKATVQKCIGIAVIVTGLVLIKLA